jgi:hypothetical protein
MELTKAARKLSQPARHLSRLFEISPRYMDSTVYTNILLDGTLRAFSLRFLGTRGGKEDSDHAPMAYIELRHGPNSIALALARLNHAAMLQELGAVEAKLYWEDDTRRYFPMILLISYSISPKDGHCTDRIASIKAKGYVLNFFTNLEYRKKVPDSCTRPGPRAQARRRHDERSKHFDQRR